MSQPDHGLVFATVMSTFTDFLRDHAKFHAPETTSDQESISDVKVQEIAMLLPEWKATEARFDPGMVDALITVLEAQCGQLPLPEEVQAHFNFIERCGLQVVLDCINGEGAASMLVHGTIIMTLHLVLSAIGYTFRIKRQTFTTFTSRVNYRLSMSEDKDVLVQIEAPNVFDLAASYLNSGASFKLDLQSRPLTEGMKVIYKACLYMGMHKTRWLALTCYTKWVFLRFHNGNEDQKPYITYSTVEFHLNNTKPFRALLGTMLATQLDTPVPSNPDVQAPLEPVYEECEGSESSTSQHDSGDLFRDETSDQVTGMEPYQTRQRPANESLHPPDVLVSWSKVVTPSDMWLQFYAADGTEHCLSLGKSPVRLRLLREIRRGSTGSVYEARLDGDEGGDLPRERNYAIKMVGKGKTEGEKGCTKRLLLEFSIYRVIEENRQNNKIGDAVPRCYGLFEGPRTLALITDYEGNSLSEDWRALTQHEKIMVYQALTELHKIGIRHNDLEPRNVVRDANGTIRIIDFTASELHSCSVDPRVDGDKAYKRGNRGCRELRALRKELGRK